MSMDASQVKPISTRGKRRMKKSLQQLYKGLQCLQPILFASHPGVLNVAPVGGYCSSLGGGKLLLLTPEAHKLLHMEYNTCLVHSNTDVF